MNRIHVVADADIPFLKGVLEPYADVEYADGRSISPTMVRCADALLVRTRTRCDEKLLGSSSVKMVCTATIGTDHIDVPYLASRNISFASAPGCNAGGVMQYVWTSLLAVCMKKRLTLAGKTMGVIGVGHTGGRVAAMAERLGMKVMRCDPPRALAGDSSEVFVSLQELLESSDIVTCHVPLDATTRGMADSSFFSALKDGVFFINASRGEVVVDDALLAQWRSGRLSGLVLDVWNGEPDRISRELLAAADIATPHIAGYSYEGKINGTAMVVQALARHFGWKELYDFVPPHTPIPVLELPQHIDDNSQKSLAASLLKIFPVWDIDRAFRSDPTSFEHIRATFPYRREFEY